MKVLCFAQLGLLMVRSLRCFLSKRLFVFYKLDLTMDNTLPSDKVIEGCGRGVCPFEAYRARPIVLLLGAYCALSLTT